MKHLFRAILSLALLASCSRGGDETAKGESAGRATQEASPDSLTDPVALARKVSAKYRVPKRKYVVIIDYTRHLFSERLHVVDMAAGRVVLSSRVSHAWRSGVFYAKDFSNVNGSEKSSPGAYVTRHKDVSKKFGPSLIIEGLDRGVNDNAKSRQIIFHSDKRMKTKWSQGCFATPEEVNLRLREMIQGGCLVYVHSS